MEIFIPKKEGILIIMFFLMNHFKWYIIFFRKQIQSSR